MSRDPTALVQYLHSLGRQANIQLLPHQGVWNAIEPLSGLDVVVDTGLGLAPLGVFVGAGGERFERRFIQLLVEIPAADRLPLEVALIEVW